MQISVHRTVFFSYQNSGVLRDSGIASWKEVAETEKGLDTGSGVFGRESLEVRRPAEK